MARAKKGVHGPVEGKVGKMVYYKWGDVEVVRAAPVRKAPPTEKEKIHRYLFGELTSSWMKPVSAFLKLGYRDYSPGVKGLAAARSYLFKHALLRDGYNSTIDPALMLVSYGDLPLSEDIQVSLTPEKQLVFSWDPVQVADTLPLDRVMLLAYNVAGKQAVMSLGEDFRKAGTATLDLAWYGAGEYHVYLSFLAAEELRQSKSVYLGMVTT